MDRMHFDVFLLGISLCDDACGGSAGNRESHHICSGFLLSLYGTPAGLGDRCGIGTDRTVFTVAAS